jgi:voltage-gated potassium channel
MKKMNSEKRASVLKITGGKLQTPMLLLSFVWLTVTLIELVNGITPLLLWLGTSIWFLFILFFCIRLFSVPSKVAFLKRNWLFIFALIFSVLRVIPFLQKFTVARAMTATFSMQVVWIFASADFGLRSLRRAMGRRGAGYAIALTFVVIIVGAAGMLYFENDSPDPQGIHTYSKAIWWTAMQITNIGSGYRPVSNGGHVLCLGISIYAAAMFGYLTAMLATMFVDRDAKDPKSAIASENSIQELQREIVQLRKLIEESLGKQVIENNKKEIT